MKHFVWSMLLISIPMTGFAQNTWEQTETKKETVEKVVVVKPNPNQKYLKGAVPVVDGKVVFSKTFEAPGKSAFDIYNIIGKFFQDVTREPNQLNSKIVKSDSIVKVLLSIARICILEVEVVDSQ